MVDRRLLLEHLRRTRFSSEGRERARSDARNIARFLYRQGARRVIGFGSAFTPSRRFTPRSDIDLAVEGLDSERFLPASSRAAAMTDFALDIVPLETATDFMRQSVQREGVVL